MIEKTIKQIDNCIKLNKEILETLDEKSVEYRRVHLSIDYLVMAKAELITKGND